MASVITLDSDEEESQTSVKATEKTTSSTPTETASKSSNEQSMEQDFSTAKTRPGPLSSKLRQIQSNSINTTSSPVAEKPSQVLSARSTLTTGGPIHAASLPDLSYNNTNNSREEETFDDSIFATATGRVTRYQKKSELELRKLKDRTSKFLADFDPETSIREKRKLNRKSYTEPKYTGKMAGVLYDEKGIHIGTGIDLCDCLDKDCVGCHYPCNNCSSAKCGQSCRVHRKWAYECIEYDGKDQIKKNPIMYRYL